MGNIIIDVKSIEPNSNSVKELKEQGKTPKRTRLNFWVTGSAKYKFTVEAEMQLNSMLVKTVIENYWLLQVEQIYDDGYLLDLVTYSPTLVTCTNDGFREMYHITRHFQKLYDEIKVTVDANGNLYQVKNTEQLAQRWKAIKNETIQYFNEGTNLEEYFGVGEEQFQNAVFMKKMISEVEFFLVYLKGAGYGYKFDTDKEFIRANAFRTADIPWKLNYGGYQEQQNSVLANKTIESTYSPNKAWIEKAYGKIPFINIHDINPKFEMKGHYTFSLESGWIRKGELEVTETVHPQLMYHKLKYYIEKIG